MSALTLYNAEIAKQRWARRIEAVERAIATLALVAGFFIFQLACVFIATVRA